MLINILLIPYALVLGLLVNYLADVLPTQRKLTQPACPACQKEFSWPGYFLYKDCPHCGAKRSRRAPIVLLLMLAGLVFLNIYPPAGLGFWLGGLVLAYFFLIVVIDLEHRLILHMTSIAGAALGLLAGSARVGLLSSLIGGTTNLLIMFGFYLLGVVYARYRARRLGTDDGEEALGFGDVTLSGVLGLILGWPLSWLALVYGILIAGVFSILLIVFLIVTKRFETMGIYTAYGPYLIAGASLLLFVPGFALRLLH